MGAQLGFVRGEMAEWSEVLGPPLAGGPVLHRLVERHLRPDARVLVVGVHEAELVDLVVRRSRAVVLVLRSRPDAVDASERYADGEVEVLCGDAGELDLAEPAEVLLALDGLERALSAEVEVTPWRQRWERITAQLTPDAQVLLGAPNPLGLAELGGAWPQLADDDADWRSVGPLDRSVPTTAVGLAAPLPGAATWSLFPDHRRPGVALPTGTAGAGSGAGALARLHAGDRLGHLDAPTTIQAAVDACRADELAGGWVAVTDVEDPGIFSAIDTDLPDGEVLEHAFLRSMAARDIGQVRALASRVASRVRELEPKAFAALATVGPAEALLADAGDLLPLVPEGERPAAPDAEALVARWLEGVATRLSRLGWRHPFPDVAGRHEVATLLGDAAGVDHDAMETAFASAALAEHGEDTASPGLVRLERENDALRAKVAWFEAAVRHRETMLAELRQKRADPRPRLQRELAEARAELEAFRGSRTYRLGRLGTSPARLVRRLRRR